MIPQRLPLVHGHDVKSFIWVISVNGNTRKLCMAVSVAVFWELRPWGNTWRNSSIIKIEQHTHYDTDILFVMTRNETNLNQCRVISIYHYAKKSKYILITISPWTNGRQNYRWEVKVQFRQSEWVSFDKCFTDVFPFARDWWDVIVISWCPISARHKQIHQNRFQFKYNLI